MKESDFQTVFGRFLRGQEIRFKSQKGFEEPTSLCDAGSSLAFELKLGQWGKRIPFARIEEHQAEALKRAEEAGGLYMKLTDLSLGQKPFDCFLLRRAYGYFVFGWHEHGVGVHVVCVRIGEYLRMRGKLEVDGWKSFSFLDATAAGGRYLGVMGLGRGERVGK